MKQLFSFLKNKPEILFIVIILFYWVSTSIVFNPIAFVLLLLFALQLRIQNRRMGMVLPSFILLICAFLLLALFSEFNEFSVVNEEALWLLTIGLLFLGSVAALAFLMLRKYLILEIEATN